MFNQFTKSYIINHVRESDGDSKMNLKRLIIAVCTRQSSEKVPFKHFFSYVFVNANVFPQMLKKKTWCYDYFEDRYELKK